MTITRKCIFQSEACLASYNIILTIILKDQKVFWRIKGLRQKKTKISWERLNNPYEGMAYSERHFHQLGPGPLGRVGLVVAMSVCVSVCLWNVPFQCDFFRASHWPSGHMIRSRPLIGPQVKWSDPGLVLVEITEPLQICIGPTICIGRESLCLLYAGFFL